MFHAPTPLGVGGQAYLLTGGQLDLPADGHLNAESDWRAST